MSGNLVINTNVGTVDQPVGIADGVTVSYKLGSTVTQTLLLNPSGTTGSQFASPVGFSVLTINPSSTIQLTAIKNGELYLNQNVNSLLQIDDTVDSFQLTNESTTETVTVEMTFVVAIASTAIPGIVTSVDGQSGAVTIKAIDYNDASGTSVIVDNGATTGIIKLRTIVAGSGIVLTIDQYDNLEITATGGSGGGVDTVDGQVGNVIVKAVDNNDATGTTLITDSGATTGLLKFKTIVAGTNISLSSDSNGNLEITGAAAPVQTVSGQTGTVVVKAIDQNDATGVSLIEDSGATTGVIKLRNIVAGVGIEVFEDGSDNVVVAYTGGIAPVTSVDGQTGAVVVKAEDNNDASGTTLISDSGATTGLIKLKTIVAGSNITLSSDANGNLEIAAANAIGVSSVTVSGDELTGALTIGAGSGISLSTSGNTITIASTATEGGTNNTLSSPQVTLLPGNAAVAMSNSNLTATIDSNLWGYNWQLPKGAVGATSGKLYAEALFEVIGDGVGFGFINGSTNWGANNRIGEDTNGMGMYYTPYASDSGVWYNGAKVSGIGADMPTAGTWVGMAVDFTNQKAWFWNPNAAGGSGGQWNGDVIANQNPATNTGGISIAAILAGNNTLYPSVNVVAVNIITASVTMNTGALPFHNTIPAGFTSWVPEQEVQDVLVTPSTLVNGQALTWNSFIGAWMNVTNPWPTQLEQLTDVALSDSTALVGKVLGFSSNGDSWQPFTVAFGANGTGVPAFNPSAPSTVTSFSNANHTANFTASAMSWAFGEIPLTVPCYFEITWEGGGPSTSLTMGIAPTNVNTAAQLGAATQGAGIQVGGTTGWYNDGTQDTSLNWFMSTGDPIGVAYNPTTRKVWFRYNGGGWNNDVIGNQNPATNTGGLTLTDTSDIMYPACCSFAIQDVVTINYGDTAFQTAAPAGFVALTGTANVVTPADVEVTNPTDGQVLAFQASTSKWVNTTGGGGGGAVSSVSGQTGAVVVEATDNNDASGTSLISDGGSTTGNIKLKTIVAGSNITLSADANGNLEIASSGSGGGAVSSVSGQTGTVVIEATDNSDASGVSLISNSGSTTGNIKLKTIVAGSNVSLTTDTNGNLEISTGAGEGSVEVPFFPPTPALFTVVNEYASTPGTVTYGANLGYNLNKPARIASVDSLSFRGKATHSGTPTSGNPFVYTAHIQGSSNGGEFNRVGLGMTDGTKFIGIVINTDTSPSFTSGDTSLAVFEFNTNATYNSTPWAGPAWLYDDAWFKIVDDGTNLTFFYSRNGLNWYQGYQQARTSFLSAVSQVGVMVENFTTGVTDALGCAITCDYYTDPDVSYSPAGAAGGKFGYTEFTLTNMSTSTNYQPTGGYPINGILLLKNDALLYPEDFSATDGVNINFTTPVISTDELLLITLLSGGTANDSYNIQAANFPKIAGFTYAAQAGTTFTNLASGRGCVMVGASAGGNPVWSLASSTAPTTSGFSVKTFVDYDINDAGFPAAGIFIQDTTGNFVSWHVNGTGFSGSQWANATTYTGSVGTSVTRALGYVNKVWLRMDYNVGSSGNLVSYWSTDGETWFQGFSVTTSANLGTVANVGIGFNPQTTSGRASFYHFSAA